MKRKIELLAPGGDVESIKAAIAAGADAIYCGLDRFNARNRAQNISLADLAPLVHLAHQHNCSIFITLNIIIVESEIPALISLLNTLANSGVDGVIVQDFGLLYLLSNYFPGLDVHASTQLTTHNRGQIQFLHALGVSRVNLSRELSLAEIKPLAEAGHTNNVLTEVFVHGSHCLSFSGICYMSSVHGGKSGNRGRCSQPCRDAYCPTPEGVHYPLNLKDISAYTDMKELYEAGVDSVKIEGRIKKFHYIYTVVDAWRKQVDSFCGTGVVSHDRSGLYSVFNRDFSNGFLAGDISNDMFIDNSRDNSAHSLAEQNGYAGAEGLERAKKEIYDARTDIIARVRKKIEPLHIAKLPLSLSISGKVASPLELLVKTADSTFVVASKVLLTAMVKKRLSREEVEKRLLPLNDTAYCIKEINFSNFQDDLFLPFQELTAIKNRILFTLNGCREPVAPIDVPRLKKQDGETTRPTLGVLIASQKDLPLGRKTSAEIYFQLPGLIGSKLTEMVAVFREHSRLIPWFSPVIIGEEFRAAVEFLEQTEVEMIVTNNTGIAYEANKRGISWIGGPHLNIANSFSLQCLQKSFHCAGAFLSSELKKMQIRQIKKPADFKLFYSIYHPIMLMTSRQCLFHQVTGCDKHAIDKSCLMSCEKRASITNGRGKTFHIEKLKGNYHTVYNEKNFLNTGIITDMPGHFFGVSIDLRRIQSKTTTSLDKVSMIRLFEECIRGSHAAAEELNRSICPSTNAQYHKGI